MTTLSDLIARLEAAKEGSRELDCLIAPFVGWKRITPSMARQAGTSHKSHGAWVAPEDLTNGELLGDSLHGVTLNRDPPEFTSSLDAALTLVPKEYAGNWDLKLRNGACCRAEIYRPSYQVDALAATPALALCIAALKAREAGR